MFYSYKGIVPVVHESAYIHPQAVVTGNVIIGRNVYVGPGAALRGDWGAIIIEDGCNIQENCILHMFPGNTVHLKEAAHIGHGAIIHGAVIGRNSLIGMNAVIMDGVEIEDECIIGALTFIKSGEKVAKRSLVGGNPHKFIREIKDEQLSWKSEGTKLYQQLAAEMPDVALPCEPLREIPANVPVQPQNYRPWKK